MSFWLQARRPPAGKALGPTLCLAAAIILLSTLSACSLDQPATNPPLVPSPAAVPSSTIQPTATGVPQPAPTVTAAVPEAVDPTATAAGCEFSYFFEPTPGTCPDGPPASSAAAEQPFEGGVMVWLEESDSITVFYADGRWQRFEDTWSEGEPENDPSITPPAGRFQPIRGFGKLWREQPGLRDALGWALGVELGFESTLQAQATAQDQPQLEYLLTYNGQVFALIQRATDQGDWVLAADNR